MQQSSRVFFLFACLKACFRLSLSTTNKKKRTITSKKHAYRPETFYVLYYSLKGGSYGNKILYKNLDLTQDFPNKISFHFLWVKMLPKNIPKIFRWPEMCPLDKILAQDFQMAAFTKILGRRDISVVPLLSTENCKTLFHTACMAVTAMQR